MYKSNVLDVDHKTVVTKKTSNKSIIIAVFGAFVIYFFFTIGTWIMIDSYYKSTLKRVIRIEKKLNAANKQIKWLRQALGVTVKGKVRDGSRLDKFDKDIGK